MLLRLDGRFVEVKAEVVADLVERARGARKTRAARERFPHGALRRFYTRYGELLGAAAIGPSRTSSAP